MTHTRIFKTLVGGRPATKRTVRRRRSLSLERLEDRTLLTATGLADFGSLAIDPSSYHETRILVRFGTGAAVQESASVAGTTLGRQFGLLPGLREVRLAPGVQVEKALTAYRANPNVVYAQPDYRVRIADTFPNDPDFSLLYGLHNAGQTGGRQDADIDAPLAWDNFTGSGETIVAVIDTGVDYTHPDLAPNMWTNPGEIPGNELDDDGNGYVDDVHGYDFANNDGDPFDDQYHGTHVAGTIGAVGNNGIGIAGVSWNAQIMAVKFLDSLGSGWTSDAILAIEYAVGNGATISNNSWGGYYYNQGLHDAIANAALKGHLFVAAAGNDGEDMDQFAHYPASYELDNIISVAASDDRDTLASFSNYGATGVDLAAPGVDVYSAMPGSAYGYLSGTSMAAPHVTGTAVLIKDLHPEWGYAEIKNTMLNSVDPIPKLKRYLVSGGRLNAGAAATGTPPPDTGGPYVTAHSPDATVARIVDGVRISFNEAIGPDPSDPTLSSFTAADVLSFVGPNGDIELVSVEPVDGASGRQFDVRFGDQADEGFYTLVVGSDIFDTSGNRMDQDRDGTQGEFSEDRYSAKFDIEYWLGPDGYGYQAYPSELLAIDLVPGTSGVFTILDGVDDGSASVDLGENTFTFYDQVFAGDGTLWVSSNGLITFGEGVDDPNNSDMIERPTPVAIATLWDNWRLDVDAEDQVLGMFDDTDGDSTPDRLIVEWNNVRHAGGSPSSVTFQAILALNSGYVGDNIIFNYPDLDTGDGRAEARQATVGIKDEGTYVAGRLLLSYDAATPFIGTGKALLVPGQPLTPVVTFDNYYTYVDEGDVGTSDAVFPIRLLYPPAEATVTVDYYTSNATASPGSDYEMTSGSLIFLPGTTTQYIVVPIIGDMLLEESEIFYVHLQNPQNAMLPRSPWLRVYINDNENQTQGRLSIEDASVIEGNAGTMTEVLVPVTLENPPADQTVMVYYETQGGSAEPLVDYEPISGTLTFLPGVTTQEIHIAVVGDTAPEGDESIYLALSHAENAAIARESAMVTIVDDDARPTASINDVSLLEGDSGTTLFVFDVSLSFPSPVTVDGWWSVRDGTATVRQGDYGDAFGFLTMYPGETTKTVTVPVLGDTRKESDEYFFVEIDVYRGATTEDRVGIGTILNDDFGGGTKSADRSAVGQSVFVHDASFAGLGHDTLFVPAIDARGKATEDTFAAAQFVFPLGISSPKKVNVSGDVVLPLLFPLLQYAKDGGVWWKKSVDHTVAEWQFWLLEDSLFDGDTLWLDQGQG